MGNPRGASKQRICPICGRTFSKADHLDRHVRSHTREKPFKCKECGRCYSRHDTLLRHQREHKAHPKSGPSGERQSPADDASIDLYTPATTAAHAGPTAPADTAMAADPDLMSNGFGSAAVLPQSNWAGPATASASSNAFMSFPNENALNHGPGAADLAHDITTQFPSWLIDDDINLDLLGFAFASTPQPLPQDWDATVEDQPLVLMPRLSAVSNLWLTRVPESQESHPVSGIATPVAGGPEVDESYRTALHRRLTIRPLEQPQLPSTEFLNSCIRLYFQRFHPILPVVHAASFRPSKANSMLLVSICSVGCLFTGSKNATKLSRHLFHTLNKAILAKWEPLMARSGEEFCAITQAALIGQTLALLSGDQKNLALVEAFHGTVISWARRSGMFRAKHPPSYNLSDSSTNLQQAWHDWAETEVFIRISHGLHIHDTELANISHHEPLLRHNTRRMPLACPDDIFAASGVEEWRAKMLQQQGPQTPSHEPSPAYTSMSETPHLNAVSSESTFALYTILEGINAYIIDLRLSDSLDTVAVRKLEDELLQYRRIHISSSPTPSNERFDIRILWHLTFIILCVDSDLLERAVGRDPTGPSPDDIARIRSWARSSQASRCVAHAALILRRMEELPLGHEPAIHTARALFSAGLVCYCYSKFGPSPADATAITREQVQFAEFDWIGVHVPSLLFETHGFKHGRPGSAENSGVLCGIADLLQRSGHWEVARRLASILATLINDGGD